MRLLHRNRRRAGSLGEADCYAHSYGEHVLDHVDPVRSEPAIRTPEIAWDVETLRHVTTEGLKRAFEERLEARRRRKRRSNGAAS